jgi:hypothetical protein
MNIKHILVRSLKGTVDLQTKRCLKGTVDLQAKRCLMLILSMSNMLILLIIEVLMSKRRRTAIKSAGL